MRDWLHQFDEVVTMLSFVWHVLSFFHQMAYLQPFSACKGCTIGELILGRLGWMLWRPSGHLTQDMNPPRNVKPCSIFLWNLGSNS
jgi:hypothetical protein